MNPWHEKLGCEVTVCQAKLCDRRFMRKCYLRKCYLWRVNQLRLLAGAAKSDRVRRIIDTKLRRLQGARESEEA